MAHKVKWRKGILVTQKIISGIIIQGEVELKLGSRVVNFKQLSGVSCRRLGEEK